MDQRGGGRGMARGRGRRGRGNRLPRSSASPPRSRGRGLERLRRPRQGGGPTSSITYLEAIRLAQHKALADDPRVFLYGQDIGTFGGAFKATKSLAKEFPGRVLDSPISEDAMVGLAIGAAVEGMRPIVEMQFADFSTCGFNQIVNQAATLHYRTGTACPIVVRLPSGELPAAGPSTAKAWRRFTPTIPASW